MPSRFVHLLCHTEYALIDSLIRIKPLIKTVADTGMPACAITDHTNLFAAVRYYDTALKAGVKPIIGVDAWLDNGEQPASRLVLLCQNNTGQQNLYRLVSRSYTHGQRNDTAYLHRDWLPGNTDGIIALSGARFGDIGHALLAGNHDEAQRYLDQYRSLFPDRFYLELQRTGRPHEEEYLHAAVELALATNTPVVATNDVCFLSADDFDAHEIRVCIHDGYTVADQRRPKKYSPQQYLRSPEEMAALFSDLPEAIENTWHIAQRCNLVLNLGKNYLPDFPIPAGKTEAEYFCDVSREGLEQRLQELAQFHGWSNEDFAEKRQAYDQRLQIELDVIIQMGFPGYFLIVSDFIQWAKEHDIPVGPGRGSGAGSLVAYALKITDLDPLAYDLLFERFLNPERVSMPDFDIDFCMEKRDDVIDYVADHYGRDKVSQIITYGSMAAKAVVRDVGRVLDHPYGFVDKIAKLVPFEVGITLNKALEQEEALQTRYNEEEDVRELIDMALKLEGLARNVGKHAGGVVIAPSALTDFSPLYCEPDGSNLVTQYDKNDVEAAGLVKFDFLGLRTLTIIKWALENLQPLRDEPLNIMQIPLDDSATFELLQAAKTTAVFQLESRGMKELIKRLQPDCFEDIIALVALFRPGPLQSGMVDDFIARKHGRAQVEYLHAELNDNEGLVQILKPTYGVIVYQEQVMQIAQVLAGYTLGGADLLRRAMGKKKVEEMAKQRSVFIDGAEKNGIKPETSGFVFDLVEKFAGYGFNKCVAGDTQVADPLTGELHCVKSLLKQPLTHIASLQTNKKMGISNVVQVMENGIKPVFTLTTTTGKRITTTANHPFLTVQGWRPLEHLQIGERIASPSRLPIAGKEQWLEHELITLGWVLSEGNTCHPSGFYFYNKDVQARDDFIAAVSQFTNTQPTVRLREDRADTWQVYAGTGQDARIKTGSGHSFVPRSGARLWLENLDMVGQKAGEKHFPTEVFRLNNACLSVLLGRYWSGDGFIAEENNMTPYAASASQRLLQELQHLLLRLGMVSTLTEKQFAYKDGRVGYTLHLLGRRSIEMFVHTLMPHIVGRDAQIQQLKTYLAQISAEKESIDTIPPEIKLQVQTEKQKTTLTWRQVEAQSDVCVKDFYGELKPYKQGFRRATIAKLADFFASETLKQDAEADIFWDSIVSIESAGAAMTYDLEVQTTHNFVANDLIIHNSHSAAYALVSYQTAWLKAHYPAAFMAAVLSADMDNTDKIVTLIDECRHMKLHIAAPNVNLCEHYFTVEGDAKNQIIRYGLGAIKGAGEAALIGIIEERKQHGTFKDLFEFCRRVDLRKVNKRVMETLVKAGALDQLEPQANRATLMASLESAMRLAEKHAADRNQGVSDMFSAFAKANEIREETTPFVVKPAWSKQQRLEFERESLGLYLTGHPIEYYLPELQQFVSNRIKDLTPTGRHKTTKVAGLVIGVRVINSKRGKMAAVTLDDQSGQVDAVVYADLFQAKYAILNKDAVLVVEGEVREDEYSGGYSMTVSKVMTLDDAREAFAQRLALHIEQPVPDFPHQLNQLLSPHRNGKCPVFIRYLHAEAEVELRLGKEWCVMPSEQLVVALRQVLGEESVKVVY